LRMSGAEVLMEPSVFVVLFPVFYAVLAVDLVALGCAIAFLVVDRRAAHEHDWRLDAADDYRRAA
jgi:hypothetical protein